MKLMYIHYLIDMKAILFIAVTLLLTGCGRHSSENITKLDGEGMVHRMTAKEMLIPSQQAEGEPTILAVTRLGGVSSITQLKKRENYAELCLIYPSLKNIKELSVDTGEGDLWLIQGLPGTSLAINEYSSDGTGEVYFRTEDVSTIIARFSAKAPGSVIINAVDNAGNVVIWVPEWNDDTKQLKECSGIINLLISE